MENQQEIEKCSFTFFIKIIILLLLIFPRENKSKSKNSNNSENLNTLNISNINTKININIITNQSKTINYEFYEYNKYFQNAKEGKILYEENLVYSQNPLISVVIPLYNVEQYINATLLSVQNQKMKDIEIILIDDCSTDNSSVYAEEAQKKDPRILLFKNKKNMGVLYSRSIGVLKARGKYIFPLDNDDMIIIDDLFDYIYEEIEEGKYDIIEFSWIESYIYDLVINSFSTKPYCVHPLDEVIYQPKLRKRFNRNENENLHFPDRFLWGKIISKELYIKSIEALGEDLKQRITIHEDTIMTFMLFKYGKSYKKIRKIGICHFLLDTTTSHNKYSNNRFKSTCLSYVNYIDILYKNIENTTMAKEDALFEFEHWIMQVACKYAKYGLEKKINITKKFYYDPMILKERKQEISKFLTFFNNLKNQ